MRPLVGQLDYLNTRPFEPLRGVRIFRASPTEIGRLARNREIHAGLLSVGDLLRVEDDYSPLGGVPRFGIACRRRAGSVFLVSRVPPDRLGGRTIEITSQTSTAVLLLEVWLSRRLGVEGVRTRPRVNRRHAAALLIGDDALRERSHPDPAYPFRTDLASAWREWTGLPFVFAVWSARRDLTPALRRRLTRELGRALDAGVARIPETARRQAGPLGDSETINVYLSDFTYRFSDAERQGLATFRHLLGRAAPAAGESSAGNRAGLRP